MSEVQTGALVAVPLKGPRLVRPIGVIYKRTRERSPMHKIFIATLRDGAAQPIAEAKLEEPAPV